MAEVLAYTLDWANLLIRWLHVTAAIAWIGTSFYYIALDYHLLPVGGEDLAGEVWEIHGGGFYRVEKYKVAPKALPSPLHWFKWEAYTTWLSGFTLLIVLYYANANTYLVDKSVADISPVLAVAISVGILVVGWLVYDALSRVLENNNRLLAGEEQKRREVDEIAGRVFAVVANRLRPAELERSVEVEPAEWRCGE